MVSRLVEDSTSEAGQFAQTYFVPRHGTPVPETVHDRDALRVVRTELELLRRIGRRSATQGPPIDQTLAARYSPQDRGELIEILHDARHPIVDEMIALIDRDFGDLRKDILMSVVNEQAENIVQEAAESGALAAAGADTAPVQPGPVQRGADPPAATEVTTQSAVKSAEPPEATVPTGEDVPVADAAPPPSGDDLGAAEAELAKVVESDDTPGDGIAPAEADIPPFAEENEPAPSATEQRSVEFTPEGAVRAVSEIEKGIRQLAAILAGEVGEQWQRARETVEQVEAARIRTEEAERKAASMLERIVRLKEETQAARNDAEAARGEARMLRKDARMAKERADASAAAAEAAADQANQEAEQTRGRACGN